MIDALVLRHHGFSKVFDVACGASDLGLGGVLSQEGHPVAFLVRNYECNNDTQPMTRNCMLLYDPFGIGGTTSCLKSLFYIPDNALKYLHSRRKLSPQHIRWAEFLQDYTFVLNHWAGIENESDDACYSLVTIYECELCTV